MHICTFKYSFIATKLNICMLYESAILYLHRDPTDVCALKDIYKMFTVTIYLIAKLNAMFINNGIGNCITFT